MVAVSLKKKKKKTQENKKRNQKRRKTKRKKDKREEVFSDRSDKWQESDKGMEYEEKTQQLEDLHFEIEKKMETKKAEQRRVT